MNNHLSESHNITQMAEQRRVKRRSPYVQNDLPERDHRLVFLTPLAYKRMFKSAPSKY